MKYIELSRKDLEEQCNHWANEIKKSYQPDLIVYVAKAGYLIGKEMKMYLMYRWWVLVRLEKEMH